MRALAASVSLEGRAPQTQGVAAGLVRIGDYFYVSLDGDVYRVSLDNAAFRIIGPDGTVGPYLMRDGNVWHLNNSRLHGGNDRSGELARERLRKKLDGPIAKAQAEIERLILAAEAATKDFNALSEQIVGLRDPVKKSRNGCKGATHRAGRTCAIRAGYRVVQAQVPAVARADE